MSFMADFSPIITPSTIWSSPPTHCDICENFYLFSFLILPTFLLSFIFEENLPYCAKIGPGLRKNALSFMREVSGNVFVSWKKKRRRRLMKDGRAAAFPPWLQNKTPPVLFWRAEEIYLGAIIGGRGLCNTIRKDSIYWIFRCDQMTSEIQLKTLFSDVRRKSILAP